MSDLMTAEELMELPDDGSTFYELSRGILICMSPSAYQPSRIAGTLLVRLGGFVDQHNLGEYGSADGGFKLASNPDTVRAPDVWSVRTDRAPAAEDPGFYNGPPDLAIEVLSPSDRFHKVMLKIRDYLDAGTPLVWVLDPRSKLGRLLPVRPSGSSISMARSTVRRCPPRLLCRCADPNADARAAKVSHPRRSGNDTSSRSSSNVMTMASGVSARPEELFSRKTTHFWHSRTLHPRSDSTSRHLVRSWRKGHPFSMSR
jgi:Uma2 family endonuclease